MTFDQLEIDHDAFLADREENLLAYYDVEDDEDEDDDEDDDEDNYRM
jgi:hypothetical protein